VGDVFFQTKTKKYQITLNTIQLIAFFIFNIKNQWKIREIIEKTKI
jgi:hypothetical protein